VSNLDSRQKDTKKTNQVPVRGKMRDGRVFQVAGTEGGHTEKRGKASVKNRRDKLTMLKKGKDRGRWVGQRVQKGNATEGGHGEGKK